MAVTEKWGKSIEYPLVGIFVSALIMKVAVLLQLCYLILLNEFY